MPLRTFYILKNGAYQRGAMTDPSIIPFTVWARRASIQGHGDVFVVRVPRLLHAWTFANACWATQWPSPMEGWKILTNPYDPYLGEPPEARVRFGWALSR